MEQDWEGDQGILAEGRDWVVAMEHYPSEHGLVHHLEEGNQEGKISDRANLRYVRIILHNKQYTYLRGDILLVRTTHVFAQTHTIGLG